MTPEDQAIRRRFAELEALIEQAKGYYREGLLMTSTLSLAQLRSGTELLRRDIDELHLNQGKHTNAPVSVPHS
jgi:hypothetical protein